MTGPTTYNVASYGHMVDQRERMQAYVDALQAAVEPGDIVFDLGAGPGLFAILACRFGAARAYAVEPDPSVLLAQEFARAEGVEDRVEIFQGLSTDFDPPQKADLIVCDLRGSLPLFETLIPSVIDARQRLLKPGGTLIPRRDRLFAALIDSPAIYRCYDEPWVRNRHGLKIEGGRRFVVNATRDIQPEPHEILSEPAELLDLDYWTIASADLEMPFALQAKRDGTAHGLALWFDSELYEGIGFKGGPETQPNVYRVMFHPFEQGVALAAGDRVEGEVFAQLSGGKYRWSWRSRFVDKGGATLAEFKQSTDFERIYTLGEMTAFDGGHVPLRRVERETDLFCLERFDGHRSLAAVAEDLRAAFPEKFSDLGEALGYAADFAQKYQRIRGRGRT